MNFNFFLSIQLVDDSQVDTAPIGFSSVRNEPPNSMSDPINFINPSISNTNDSTETTVDDNDHSIGMIIIIYLMHDQILGTLNCL